MRDSIGEELEAKAKENPDIIVRRASRDELELLLRAKIVEEAVELASTGNVDEAADLIEALRSWLELKGIALEEVFRVSDFKRSRDGGFSKGYLVFWLNRDTC